MCDRGLQMDNELFRLREKFCPFSWLEVLPARLQHSKSVAIGGGNGSVAWVDLGGWEVFKETRM